MYTNDNPIRFNNYRRGYQPFRRDQPQSMGRGERRWPMPPGRQYNDNNPNNFNYHAQQREQRSRELFSDSNIINVQADWKSVSFYVYQIKQMFLNGKFNEAEIHAHGSPQDFFTAIKLSDILIRYFLLADILDTTMQAWERLRLSLSSRLAVARELPNSFLSSIRVQTLTRPSPTLSKRNPGNSMECRDSSHLRKRRRILNLSLCLLMTRRSRAMRKRS